MNPRGHFPGPGSEPIHFCPAPNRLGIRSMHYKKQLVSPPVLALFVIVNYFFPSVSVSSFDIDLIYLLPLSFTTPSSLFHPTPLPKTKFQDPPAPSRAFLS